MGIVGWSIIIGVAILLVGVIVLLMFYEKVPDRKVLIRTGLWGEKVSIDSLLVLPNYHKSELLTIRNYVNKSLESDAVLEFKGKTSRSILCFVLGGGLFLLAFILLGGLIYFVININSDTFADIGRGIGAILVGCIIMFTAGLALVQKVKG